MKSNREITLAALANVSPVLKSEIDYRMEQVEHEGEYSLVDAFEDTADYLDMEGTAKEKSALNDVYVIIGYAQPMTKEDLERTVVSSGKKYWFIRNGVHYREAESWEQWIRK